MHLLLGQLNFQVSQDLKIFQKSTASQTFCNILVTWGGVKNSKLQKIRSLQKKKAIRVVNNSTFKAHSNPLSSKLKVLNLDDTYKLCVLTFMYRYFNDNLRPSSKIYLSLQLNPIEQIHINQRVKEESIIARGPPETPTATLPETSAFSTETQKFSSETPNRKFLKI